MDLTSERIRGLVKSKYRISFLIITILTLGSSLAAVAQNRGLPNIVILATGGTIAGAAATGTQAGYTSGAVTIDALLRDLEKENTNKNGEPLCRPGHCWRPAVHIGNARLAFSGETTSPGT